MKSNWVSGHFGQRPFFIQKLDFLFGYAKIECFRIVYFFEQNLSSNFNRSKRAKEGKMKRLSFFLVLVICLSGCLHSRKDGSGNGTSTPDITKVSAQDLVKIYQKGKINRDGFKKEYLMRVLGLGGRPVIIDDENADTTEYGIIVPNIDVEPIVKINKTKRVVLFNDLYLPSDGNPRNLPGTYDGTYLLDHKNTWGIHMQPTANDKMTEYIDGNGKKWWSFPISNLKLRPVVSEMTANKGYVTGHVLTYGGVYLHSGSYAGPEWATGYTPVKDNHKLVMSNGDACILITEDEL